MGTRTPEIVAGIDAQPAADQSFAAPQDAVIGFNEPLSTFQLFSQTQLREVLGVPADALLRTQISTAPPPLPSPHRSRSSVFPDLARQFDSHRVLAVTGYPECGKTVAIAEFAYAYPGRTFWFSAYRSETHPDAWLGGFCFSLGQHLDAGSFLADGIRSALVGMTEPLLLVIDNVERCRDLEALEFLFEAAEATAKLSVLLVGTDEPRFVSGVRSRGIVDWRLPGLRQEEARLLVELNGIRLSSEQLRALEFLRLRVDGHLGMLRLSREELRRIKTVEDCDAFISRISAALGSSLDALQSAMVERLREGMDNDQVQLCRRLSVVIGPFPRRVGRRVWTIDRPNEDFHRTWNGCVVGVFEPQGSGKYELPELYRDGFRQEADGPALQSWHGAIADGFEEREGDSLDVFDVQAAVVHRFLSGNVPAALDSASMYLALAAGPYARPAQAFLIRRFETWLGDSAKSPAIPATQRIRWHAIRAHIYEELDLKDKSQSATEELYELLCTTPLDAAPDAAALGWTRVLLQASKSGKPDLALVAIGQIAPPAVLPEFKTGHLPWREFFVISAFLNSSESPLDYLRTAVKGRINRPEPEALWSDLTGYEFWRATAAAIYSTVRDHNLERAVSEDVANQISALARDLRTAGEPQIASVMECLLVQVRIDVLRDFATASNDAERTAGLLGNSGDARISAYVHDTRGDALRCAGRDNEALIAYAQALSLWPASQSPDMAETLLMRGISQAKLGRFREGTAAATAAALLYNGLDRAAGTMTWNRAAARCLLEAAVFSIHGEDYSRCVRCLIHAHQLLREKHRQNAEWPALSQIAWALANRLKPDPNNPQPPGPGFSLGLLDVMAGAEKMLSCAPTMMLARACAAVGRPHRAMAYFDAALIECDADDLRTQVGSLALDSAIDARDLVGAARYAALGSAWLLAPPGDFPGREVFVFDHLIGRSLQLASFSEGDEASGEIDRAIAALGELPIENAAVSLLHDTLVAYRRAPVEGDDSSLEVAFQTALQHAALWVARDIAWFWSYRFSLGRPVYETQCLLWHWRVCWLSMEIAPTDTAYLAAVLRNEHSFWTRVAEIAQYQSTDRIIHVLEKGDQAATGSISTVVTDLATIACELLNVTEASRELASALRLSKHPRCLAKPLDALYIRLLGLLLHPGAPYLLSTLQADVTPLLDALRPAQSLSDATEQFNELESLMRMLETNAPSEHTFEALRRASERATELNGNSAAQLYIWLRHLIGFSGNEFGFDKLSQLLGSTHVVELLQGTDLLPYIRVRLATCHLVGRAFEGQRRLQHALAAIASQQKMRSPIAVSAVSSAQSTRRAALDELASIVHELQSVQAQATDADLKDEVRQCCLELGGIRRLVGTALLIQGGDESARHNWLRPAIDDFRGALQISGELESSENVNAVLTAAYGGRSLARALDDPDTVVEFSNIIEQIRSTGRYNDLILAQESLESSDLLNGVGGARHGHFPRPEEEGKIQSFTDHVMESTGWPRDRRKHVEEDFRKMARVEVEQEQYCRHLQPLQNLLHTQSPQTVYASPTKYTCSCVLYGHETKIESDDIDTVINAMKRVYCDSCQSRSPRVESADVH